MSDGRRRRIVAWVRMHILPQEPAVRAWLRRSMLTPDDIDDVIQEAYCKLSALHEVDHIVQPTHYFFQVVRNILGAQLRRARVVQIETVAELESLPIEADVPSAERTLAAQDQLARVRELIDALPDRCRRVIVLRKLEGLSQREVAKRLNVTESIVENEGVKGMRLVMKALMDEESDSINRAKTQYEPATKRR